MLKFVHAADIHLDSPLCGLSRYESAPVASIRNACRRALENLVDLAITEKAAFVLLAGDLYDGDWKDYSTGIFFSRQMGRLGREGIRVFAVAGNHDATSNSMTRALETPANMTLLSSCKPQTLVLDEFNVAIHGQSFRNRHVQDNLARDYPQACVGRFNIGLMHTSLDGREGHNVYAPCSVDDLRTKGYQYWALGHVHTREIVCTDPLIVFPGCIQGRHIRETGGKGCMLVTVEDMTVTGVEPVALDVFRWSLCPVDVEGAEDENDISRRIRSQLQKERDRAEGRPLGVRVRLYGATKMAEALTGAASLWLQRVRMLGAEVGDGDIWVERIELATSGQLDPKTPAAKDSGFALMLRAIESIPCAFESIPNVPEMVDELVQKIPAEALGPDSGFDLHNPRTVQGLVDEAKHLLVSRLLRMGVDHEN